MYGKVIRFQRTGGDQKLDMEKVTVIVLNWNGAKVLPRCLEAIMRQTYTEFHLVVVDNGSSDGSADLVSAHGRQIDLISLNQNLGFCKANNVALRAVVTPYVALLNNDAFPAPDWLEALVAGLERYPEAGFAASKLLFDNARDVIDRAGDGYTTAGAAYLRGRGAHSFQYDEEEMVFGACAAAALYRTEMLRNVGLFDEDFFLLHEDVDLSFRAQLKGYKCLYVPDAIAYHKASSSIVYDSPISVYYSHRNLEWVYLKNMPPKLILKTIGLHIIYNIAALLFFASKGRIKEFIKAKWDAFKGLKGILKKRRHIQSNRRVDDNYIWGLLEKELFLPRLTRRLGKN